MKESIVTCVVVVIFWIVAIGLISWVVYIIGFNTFATICVGYWAYNIFWVMVDFSKLVIDLKDDFMARKH